MPSVDEMPSEILSMIVDIAVRYENSTTNHSISLFIKIETVLLDMNVPLFYLLANSRLRAACIPHKDIILCNVAGSITRLTSDRAIRDYYESEITPKWYNWMVRNLEIDAKLLLYFQRTPTRPCLI
jgi:hypothetical protein